MANTANTLRFKNLKVGDKFVGRLIGIEAPNRDEFFIKINPATNNKLFRLGIRDQNWNAVRLSDGNLCSFALTQEITKIEL